MSLTALQVITRALKRAAIIQYGETPTSDQADDALNCLNEMLHTWQLDGIDLNFTDLSLSTTLPYPDNHTSPIVDNLIVRICREYGKDLNAEDVAFADNGYTNLQNYYSQPTEVQFDPTITYGVNIV